MTGVRAPQVYGRLVEIMLRYQFRLHAVYIDEVPSRHHTDMRTTPRSHTPRCRLRSYTPHPRFPPSAPR